MKKIPSIFKRDYEGNRLAYDEVVEGCEWVFTDGIPTYKWDGTACAVRGNALFKRYDRRVSKKAKKRGKSFFESDFKDAPNGWIPAESSPNIHTGHWPGWLLVDENANADRWHREGYENTLIKLKFHTYELVGPKIQGNPHHLEAHELYPHGVAIDDKWQLASFGFDTLKAFLQGFPYEGLVFYHASDFEKTNIAYTPIVDSPRMAKIRRKDFGFDWPTLDSDSTSQK